MKHSTEKILAACFACLTVSCVDSKQWEKACGAVFEIAVPDGLEATSLELFVFDPEGKNLLWQIHDDSPDTGVSLPEIIRGEDYLIAACANVSPGNLSEGASSQDLASLRFNVDSISSKAWRDGGRWPLVLDGGESGVCMVRVPEGGPDEAMPQVRLTFRPAGDRVGLKIDGSGLGRSSVEIEDVFMSSASGEFHPFAGAFFGDRGSAPQRPSPSEAASLQAGLRSAGRSPACIFYSLAGIDSSEDYLCVRLRIHGANAPAMTRLFTHRISDSMPDGMDPGLEHAEYILDIENSDSGITGAWTSVRADNDGPVSMTFSVSGEEGILTRAGDASVSRLDIWISTLGGSYPEYYGHAESAQLSMTLPKAAGYKVWAAVNLPDGAVSPGSALNMDIQSLTVSVSDQTADKVVMSGIKTGVDILKDNVTVTVPVQRRLAKVSIGTVRNELEAPYTSSTVSLDGIYIINGRDREGVFDNIPMGYIGHWFNCSGLYGPSEKDFGQSEAPPLSGGLFSSPKTIPHGGAIADGTFYYTARNSVDTDRNWTLDEVMAASSWTVRKTRIVLECTIEGSKCWYPVTLPSVADNCHYSIESITLKHPGSSSPDIPISTGTAQISMKINPWTDLTLTEKI